MAKKEIPVSVFTGFLGAGKTSIILSLMKQLPRNYKVVLLKNEFGDVEVDSQLAKESAVESVSEILNGCMCCVLVGQMRSALLEIQEKFSPDRIIIESSGSAFPATLAWQVRQLDDEGLKLDAVITVIDCLNFKGYEDTSPTAKMQAKYTDLLLLNKHELASERQLDDVLDSLYELNTETPKLKVSRDVPVQAELIFGLLSLGGTVKESKVFSQVGGEALDRKESHLLSNGNGTEGQHNDEVETKSIWKGGSRPGHAHTHVQDPDHSDHAAAASTSNASERSAINRESLQDALAPLLPEEVYRVKGFILLTSSDPASTPQYHILNWAFGRYDLHTASEAMAAKLSGENVEVRLTAMGQRGEMGLRVKALADKLGAQIA